MQATLSLACCFFPAKALDMVRRNLAITSRVMPIPVNSPLASDSPPRFPAKIPEIVRLFLLSSKMLETVRALLLSNKHAETV